MEEEEEEKTTTSWWSVFGSITGDISNILGYFDKSDIELAQMQLSAEELKLQQEEEKQKQLRNTLIIVGIIVLLIVTIIMFFKFVKK